MQNFRPLLLFEAISEDFQLEKHAGLQGTSEDGGPVTMAGPLEGWCSSTLKLFEQEFRD